MNQRLDDNENLGHIQLRKNNPYLLISDETGVDMYLIPQDLMDKAIKIDKMTCVVRFVCLCDCLIALYYMIFGYIYAILFFMISFSGYLSTINHKRSLMFCYVIYQYFQIISRFLIFSYWLQELDKSSKTNSQADLQNKETLTINVMFSAFLCICQSFITYFVQKYYFLLPKNNERIRIDSLNRNNVP